MRWGAAAAAASAAATAVASAASPSTAQRPSASREDYAGNKRRSANALPGDGVGEGGNKKFAPRFDGMRFIETLVTAHR